MEAKWGVGKGGGLGKAPWFEAYDDAVSELHDFQENRGIPDCPECGSPPSCCYCCTVACPCGVRAIGATRGLRDIDAGRVVRRVRRLSASKEKKVGFLDLPTAGFLRF